MKKIQWLLFSLSLTISCTSSVETQIPSYKAKLFKADTVDLQAVSKNKISLLSIWSIFCGPCLKELPELQTLYDHYKNNPHVSLITLALNTEEELNRFSSPAANQEDIYRKVFKHSGLTYFTLPVLVGTHSPYQIENGNARLNDVKTAAYLKQLFRFDAIPTTRIYDRQGTLVFEQKGVETSVAGLRAHRINLTRKLDSLITL